MCIYSRTAFLLGATVASTAAHAQLTGGERDVLPQAQVGMPAKGQAHCPL